MAEESSGSFETRSDAGKGDEGVVRLWLSALDLAEKEEADWLKKCGEISERYRLEKERKKSQFNILYSNVSTLAPALYNATPIPDVRRRYRDKDETGKIVARVIERGLSYSIDTYDFDGTIRGVVHNSLLYGRGVPRVRYVPQISKTPSETNDPAAPPSEDVVWESVECEIVDYRDFRRGPGRRWSEVPWVAFRHRLTRNQAIEKFDRIGAQLKLDYVADGKKDEPVIDDVFKRATVWEIWDKEARQVVFIAPAYKAAPIKVVPDPLGLQEFYPVPRPLYDVDDPDCLIPVIPYTQYEDQERELNDITDRLRKLIKVLRWRGVRAAIEEFEQLKDADDGDLVPVQNWQQLMASQGIDKAFWLMPIDQLILVIKELYIAREQVKQTIFEITGVADIMRGQSDPNETLGAQRLKAQFGSQRMQRRQKEVQRLTRDVMRMKAELIAEKFSPDTLQLMTGVELPSPEQKMQAQQMTVVAMQSGQPAPEGVDEILSKPTWDEVTEILRSDVTRRYRIDIETDSTIEADQLMVQQNMGQFVEGSAKFFQSIGAAVQTGAFPPDVAVDLYSGFARNFKLGRQAEDALDRLSEEAQQAAKQPRPNPQDAEAAKAKAETDAKTQIESQRIQSDDARHQRELEFQQRKHADEMAFKERQSDADRQAKSQIEGQRIEASSKPAAMIQLDAQGAIQQVADTLGNLASDQSTALVQAVNTLAEISQGFQQATAMIAAAMEKMNLPRETVLHKRGGQKVAISRPVMQ